MSRSFKSMALIAVLTILFPGLLRPQESAFKSDRSKGLIPLNAEQDKKILTTWPRVERVNLNWLGLERVNKVRTSKGKTPLDPSAARPVGQEVEGAIRAPGSSVLAVAGNGEILGDLPVSVDNSLLPYFPPIRSQGAIGSCASFATTYYQLSYMTAFERGLDIRNPDDNTNKYSPKWTYNFVNHGYDGGSTFDANYYLIQTHGAATWAEFPYDDNYLAWCLDTAAWRNALSVKPRLYQYSSGVSTDAGLELAKELLNNGYIIVFGTYIDSWQGTIIQDDLSTPDDDAEVGKVIGYWVNGYEGAHAMTVVGYNDAIWTDINANGTIEPGEKGAFRVANSWGTDWADGGFVWAAYDALRSVSAVPGAPSEGRIGALQQDRGYLLTPRDDYSPTLIGEFTINHAKRYQLALATGRSSLSVTEPETGWIMYGLYQQGGNYAFDGTTTACDGTFVFDFTDIAVSGEAQRYYLYLGDQLAGDPGTVSYFKLIDTTTEPETEILCTMTPVVFDNGYAYPYVDYTFTGPDYNHPPVLTNGYVSPTVGDTNAIYSFYAYYSDYDEDIPVVSDVYIDDVPHTMTLYSGDMYRYQTTLGVGTHTFRFRFEDGNGGTGLYPPSGATIEGPVVGLPHNVTVPSIPSGDADPARGVSHAYSTGGSVCDQAHDVQYRFDWGDGTLSDWLAVGVTSASHAWNSSGPFLVKAQARCAVATAVVSAWSAGLPVTVDFVVPLTESFPTSSFPVMWTQQNIGTGITNRWSVRSTDSAGGQPYEMRCAYQDINPATTRLVTPPIDTTGHTSLLLSFKHYLNAYSAGCTLKVQTSPDGTTWTDEAWVIESTSSNVGPETADTVLTHNLGIETTYVAFVIAGDLYAFDYWYIDDVAITQASAAKVDFNGDGQEDVLWRYYGTGDYQGLNVIWLMNQTETLSPEPLAAGRADRGDTSVLLNAGGSPLAPSPQRIGSPRPAAPPTQVRSILTGTKKHAKKPGLVMKSPMDRSRAFMDTARARGGSRDPRLRGVPVRKDAAAADILASGAAEIASLQLATEVVFSQVLDTSWEIAGTGDFNSDGKTDILWRYYGGGAFQGLNDIWFMDGTTFVSEAVFSQVADTNWRIAGTGDFNGDGETDILWRYYGTGAYQGLNVIWYMNDATFVGETVFSQVLDTDWRIEGTGDFNADGETDILWRYYGTGAYQGLNDIWFMNDATFQGEAVFSQILDTNWQIGGTGDFNNDGQTDILWRYYGTAAYQGLNDIWYMNGTTFVSEEVFSLIPDTNWKIVNR